MRGGHVHNHILLPPVLAELEASGATITLEARVKVDARSGAVDVLASIWDRCLVVEVETSSARAAWDVEKAGALKADCLAILAPTAAVANSCRQKIEQTLVAKKFPGLRIQFLTLGTFRPWLASYARLVSSQPRVPSALKTPSDQSSNSPLARRASS